MDKYKRGGFIMMLIKEKFIRIIYNVTNIIKNEEKDNQEEEIDYFASIRNKKKPRSINEEPVEVDFNKLRFLMADDFQQLLDFQANILRKTGATVEMATSGRQALEMFEQSEIGYYDVILADIEMFNMNGMEMAREIRELKRSDADLVTIFSLSSYSRMDLISPFLFEGIDAHLDKILKIDELYTLLQTYLRKPIDAETQLIT